MAEAAFKIDGTEYPMPDFETYNMDELQVLYDCSGFGIEDFAVDEDDDEAVEERDKKAKSPGILKAQLVVALMRSGLSKRKAMAQIGAVNVFELLSSVETEDDEDPTSPQKSEQPSPVTTTDSDEKPESSGSDSLRSSDPADETQPPTGTTD